MFLRSKSLVIVFLCISVSMGARENYNYYENPRDPTGPNGEYEYFWAENQQGYNLMYQILTDSTVKLIQPKIKINSNWQGIPYSFLCDTLYIPEYVYRGDSILKVVTLENTNALFKGCDGLTTIFIPKTINQLEEDCNTIDDPCGEFYLDEGNNRNFQGLPLLQNIIVDEQNEYYCDVDGVVYSKDKKRIVCFPMGRADTIFTIPDIVQVIGPNAFQSSKIHHISTPRSLRKICAYGLNVGGLKEIILKDSVNGIGHLGISISPDKLVIGTTGDLYINTLFLRPKQLYLHALVPPRVWQAKNCFRDIDSIQLFVPRKSLSLYQKDSVWGKFTTILPIEPPIVTGVDTASVSWVQNFSATGYVWTLYTNEAKTQRFMSLTFDANGHLTHIDINSSHMPERMPALYSEDGEEEKRFAEYYSFTISGLSPETRYYYTRQSLNGTEVIDEEVGSFATLSNEEQGIEGNVQSGKGQYTKILHDGHVLIHKENKKYTINGEILEL